MFKRYDELKKGDKIWFYGYKAFVRDIIIVIHLTMEELLVVL